MHIHRCLCNYYLHKDSTGYYWLIIHDVMYSLFHSSKGMYITLTTSEIKEYARNQCFNGPRILLWSVHNCFYILYHVCPDIKRESGNNVGVNSHWIEHGWAQCSQFLCLWVFLFPPFSVGCQWKTKQTATFPLFFQPLSLWCSKLFVF